MPEEIEESISPLRKIVRELMEKNLGKLPTGLKVLEVGCGRDDFIKQRIEKSSCSWEGVDPAKNSIATHRETVAGMPFEDNYFDYVVSSQNIEHWYEYSTTFRDGLTEIFRILKPGGSLLIDYPINLHGHSFFMLNRRDKIYSILPTELWDLDEFKQYHPERPYYTWQGNRRKTGGQFIMQWLLKRRNESAYIEQIILKKKNTEGVKTSFITNLKNTIEKIFFNGLRMGRFLMGLVVKGGTRKRMETW